MTTLIERLRSFGGFKNEMEICDEAADEIERLTAENLELYERSLVQAKTIMELTAGRDAVYEAYRMRKLETLTAESDLLKEQMTADRKQFLDMRDENKKLAAALAQPKQEPVAWMRPLDVYYMKQDGIRAVEVESKESEKHSVPLFAGSALT